LKVPFLNLRDTYLELKSEINEAVLDVLDSGQYILGQQLDRFETDWARFCEAKFAVGTGNGLDALYLALKAIGIKPGDEVIVPSYTFIATWLAVSRCGAIPIPVEPLIDTYNINPDLIESAVSSKTKAIVPVHLFGQPADIEPIRRIAKKYGLMVVEDAAQAHGARYNGRRIGAHSDVVAWSFYPGKNLGAFGDAGAITTDNFELASKVRTMSNYGSRDKYIHEVEGINSRLDPIQAAVLSVKLMYLDAWNDRRSRLAAAYLFGLKDSSLVLPVTSHFAESVWHLFVVRTEMRDSVRESLEGSSISTLVHYPVPPHLQRTYRSMRYRPQPIAELLASQVLSLPFGPHLQDDQQQGVIRCLTDIDLPWVFQTN
jgi:dTDP-4-amino-4,6-dideoxygalactose transaminase